MPCSTLHELTWCWEVLTRQCGGYRDTPDTPYAAHLHLAPGKGPAGRGGARGGARGAGGGQGAAAASGALAAGVGLLPEGFPQGGPWTEFLLQSILDTLRNALEASPNPPAHKHHRSVPSPVHVQQRRTEK